MKIAVFHVRDEHGNKLKDQNVINHIQQVLQELFLSHLKIALRSLEIRITYVCRPSENQGDLHIP